MVRYILDALNHVVMTIQSNNKKDIIENLKTQIFTANNHYKEVSDEQRKRRIRWVYQSKKFYILYYNGLI